MKNTVCAIPWTHLNIIPRGKVYPCCMTSEHRTYAGDLTTQTIEEIWNSDYMKDIRVQMLNGEEPNMCRRCFESEKTSDFSTRLNHNRYFAEKLKEIPEITREDGFVEKVDLRYWDFRFSNLCNYKCRTCGPEFSSAWIPDAKEMGWVSYNESKKVLNIESVDESKNVDFLKKYVGIVEKVYFAGGEPLLMDEHWQILDMLDAAEKYNVIITYNTNLSVLKYKNKNVIDYWKKWGRNVWLWPSIDEIDERAELIRSGTNWKNVEENLKTVSSIGIHCKPSITVSNMNVHRIPEIVTRLVDIGAINGHDEHWQNFSFNVVEYNPQFHVSALSDFVKEKIKEKLNKFISDFNSKYGVDINSKFLHLFWHLDKPFNQQNRDNFVKYTKKLDLIRNESLIDVIPELKEMFDAAI
jgi:radical SAM protein with 4Fe4S-binding SPASM domain